MKIEMKCWQPGMVAVMVLMALTLSTPAVFADDINPGVFPIDSKPYGLTYGQWSAKWWQWAFSQTTFDNCPNESGRVWFLVAPTNSNCTVPARTAIMFPTFNAEWSDREANAQGFLTPGKTCLVPTQPNGTSYAALLACARAQADNATDQEDNSTGTLEADLDGRMLQSLEEYRAHSAPSPFAFTAVPGNPFGLCGNNGISPIQPCPLHGHAVADGFWIMLRPLNAGKHTLHFAATVSFPNVTLPNIYNVHEPFTFSTEAKYCLIVQPSNQTCP